MDGSCARTEIRTAEIPVLRALALSGFVGGTALLVGGILLDDLVVAGIGAVTWIAGVGVGLWSHRISP